MSCYNQFNFQKYIAEIRVISNYVANYRWRQYGLWERYTDLYPTQDLVYTVGQSDWRTDWFFAHLNRYANRFIKTCSICIT